MKFKLIESSLSRIYNYVTQYDIACISADQYLPNRQDYTTQKEYEDEFHSRLGKQKKLDAKALMLSLKAEFGTVISIKGFYQYNSKSIPSKEKSYCVVNKNNDLAFKEKMLDFAKKAKQNSFYYIPKNTLNGYWIYTGIDLSEVDEIDKQHNCGDETFKGPVHFAKYKITDFGTGYSLVNGRPMSSYLDSDNGEIGYSVPKIKLKNRANNITVIEEGLSDNSIPEVIRKEDGEYLKYFKFS